MPSNAEITKDIEENAATLGLTVDTSGQNNAQLATTLRDLKAKVTDAETHTAADDAAPAVVDGAEQTAMTREETPEDEAPVYKVAAGVSLTSRRGVKADGDIVAAGDFIGGERVLAILITSGRVVKA